jgi:hypothetical protein
VPEIDVTDVLIDSDVAGTSFTVIRRQEVVGQNGVAVVTPHVINNVLGSVQASGDNSLIREDTLDAQTKTLRVVTQFRLRGVSAGPSASGYKPDVILWNGDHFEVRMIEDWSQFGGGFIDAECVEIDYVGPPPSFAPPYVGRLDFSQSVNSQLAHGAGAF